MKIATWNINGLRSGFEQLLNFINIESPEIICLQEIKISDDKILMLEKIDGYKMIFNPAKKSGYSGVGVLTKIQPIEINKELGKSKFDDEGRGLIIEYKNFILVNLYFPHTRRDLSRMDYKSEFNDFFFNFAKSLKNKKVIFCGDFNVAHTEIDLARPKQNDGNPGFTAIERSYMDKFLKLGLIDVFRYLNPNMIQYTWWSNFANARSKNIGWRIDYFLVFENLINKVKDCRIIEQQMGSDHCPVIIELDEI